MMDYFLVRTSNFLESLLFAVVVNFSPHVFMCQRLVILTRYFLIQFLIPCVILLGRFHVDSSSSCQSSQVHYKSCAEDDEKGATNHIQVLSYNLKSTQKCDVSNGHSCEISVQAVTTQNQ